MSNLILMLMAKEIRNSSVNGVASVASTQCTNDQQWTKYHSKQGHGFAAEDAVYIVTDVMGGSVNNEMLTLLPEYPAVHLICGMNASLVLTLASNDEALTQDELAECIADAKAQIIDCNLLLKNAAQDEEDDL